MAIAGTAAPKAAKPKVDTVSTRQLGAALAEKHEMSHKAANGILEDIIGDHQAPEEGRPHPSQRSGYPCGAQARRPHGPQPGDGRSDQD